MHSNPSQVSGKDRGGQARRDGGESNQLPIFVLTNPTTQTTQTNPTFLMLFLSTLLISMGEIAVKTIVMYFSFEVLTGELRGELRKIAIGVLAALALLAVRGMV